MNQYLLQLSGHCRDRFREVCCLAEAKHLAKKVVTEVNYDSSCGVESKAYCLHYYLIDLHGVQRCATHYMCS